MIALLAFAALLSPAAARHQALRHAEGYAVATCLIAQPDRLLREQGEGWASVVVQGGAGSIEPLLPIARAVTLQMTKGDVPVAHLDGPPDGDRPLPILWCASMVDRPAVRAAIRRATVLLTPAYRHWEDPARPHRP